MAGLKEFARELRGKAGPHLRIGVSSGIAQAIVPRIISGLTGVGRKSLSGSIDRHEPPDSAVGARTAAGCRHVVRERHHEEPVQSGRRACRDGGDRGPAAARTCLCESVEPR